MPVILKNFLKNLHHSKYLISNDFQNKYKGKYIYIYIYPLTNTSWLYIYWSMAQKMIFTSMCSANGVIRQNNLWMEPWETTHHALFMVFHSIGFVVQTICPFIASSLIHDMGAYLNTDNVVALTYQLATYTYLQTSFLSLFLLNLLHNIQNSCP